MRQKLVTFAELAEYGITLKRQQIGRLERAGKFPKRVQVSENRIAWLEKDIVDHVAAKIRAREGRPHRG